MIKRKIFQKIKHLLSKTPVVVLMGPRQVGKTTLAYEVSKDQDSLYVDLERPSDLAKLNDIEYFMDLHRDKLVVLDEVQRRPDLFPTLRSIIDERRREGKKNNLFLMLGSCSLDLLQQSSETLAGRVAYIELCPFSADEVDANKQEILWNRGGFPESFLAGDDQTSFEWRYNFINTYIERDIPQLGPRIPSETIRRFWTMLAHNQGQIFNAADIARGLDVKGITVSRYLDLMVDLLLVRRLRPWTVNIGKRLIKAPKTYIRDSGLCHALLGISNMDSLLGSPVVGGSYEGFIIENVLQNLPYNTSFGYYRTAGGAEIDLVISWADGELWAIEIKLNRSPQVSKGFHMACNDLKPQKKFLIYSGKDQYPIGNGITVISLREMIALITSKSP